MNKKTQPGLVSVIVPTFNRALLITESLNSVNEQTYRPIELIIVDDGSTDTTKDIVRAWSEKHADEEGLCVRYIQQENAGPSAARNTGLKAISGQYVQYLDSDDRLHPERFRQLVTILESEGADFVQSGFEGFSAQTGLVIEEHFGRPSESQVELALRGLLWANTLRSMFARSLIEKIGPWDIELTCFEDRDYVERAVMLARKPIAVREILAGARRGGDNRISDRLRSYEGRTARVLCEERLAGGALNRVDISQDARSAFASRIYALGFRSNASGWPDLGRRCGDIAGSMNATLDTRGKIRYLVWKSGRIGGLVYRRLSKIKKALGVN